MAAEFFKALETASPGTGIALEAVLDALPWGADGLLPAIAQDTETGQVLMLAWMNRDALERTLGDGRAWYFSRSRGRLWQKGETSGHVQDVKAVRFDCDGDAILLQVHQTGPACHTNRPSCFYLELDTAGDAREVRVISEPL